ncbi:MAG: tryptophan synthase subunit alpha [Arcanobacterium sp.]|nr:tryptophan synthase subunit alpha [Arcanobacterium sp.]
MSEQVFGAARIGKAFENGKAFISFITCGDPDLETTARVVREAAARGADLVELGIPFSDPTAEGPVIQEANMRALSGGVTTDKVFDLVRDLRTDVEIPLVFMTYANVVFSYGAERFIETCRQVGIDGLILPDLPFEEREEFSEICDKFEVALIPLVAPTSEQRIAQIAQAAQGFIYIVSSLGVTGVRSEITTDIAGIVEVIRDNTDVPCAVGFGISRPDQAREMAAKADGVIVGSAIIKLLAEHGREAVPVVGDYVSEMKQAANSAG